MIVLTLDKLILGREATVTVNEIGVAELSNGMVNWVLLRTVTDQEEMIGDSNVFETYVIVMISESSNPCYIGDVIVVTRPGWQVICILSVYIPRVESAGLLIDVVTYAGKIIGIWNRYKSRTEILYSFYLYVGAVAFSAAIIPGTAKLFIYMISRFVKLCWAPLTRYKVRNGWE